MDIVKSMRLEVYGFLEKNETLQTALNDSKAEEKIKGWYAEYLVSDQFGKHCDEIIELCTTTDEVNKYLKQLAEEVITKALKEL